jgi:hypothetical protein
MLSGRGMGGPWRSVAANRIDAAENTPPQALKKIRGTLSILVGFCATLMGTGTWRDPAVRDVTRPAATTGSTLGSSETKCRAPAVIALLLLAIVVASPARAQTGAYTVNGGTASRTGQTYAATVADQSAVYVINSGHLTLTNCTMTKTGDASNVNNSSQYGINAGILAGSGGTVTITGGSVTTNASGDNGLFATGSGSSISMSGGTINAAGGGAHGVDATYGGSVTLTNVDVTTTGSSSSALATDFGGGAVTVTGGTITSSNTAPNSHSAGIYSTGNITVTGATVTSRGDCGGVIDGANSISLDNTALTGVTEGIKIWKTAPMSGAATVVMDGGSLTVTAGDAFYLTAETGNAAAASITCREAPPSAPAPATFLTSWVPALPPSPQMARP